MDIDKKTLFGSELSVRVYSDLAQYKGKISITVHPSDVNLVKEKINGKSELSNRLLFLAGVGIGFIIAVILVLALATHTMI